MGTRRRGSKQAGREGRREGAEERRDGGIEGEETRCESSSLGNRGELRVRRSSSEERASRRGKGTRVVRSESRCSRFQDRRSSRGEAERKLGGDWRYNAGMEDLMGAVGKGITTSCSSSTKEEASPLSGTSRKGLASARSITWVGVRCGEGER